MATEVFAGVTAIETSAAGLTVRAALPLIAPLVAVMVGLPTAVPVARPVEAMLAPVVEDQVTVVNGCVLPSV